MRSRRPQQQAYRREPADSRRRGSCGLWGVIAAVVVLAIAVLAALLRLEGVFGEEVVTASAPTPTTVEASAAPTSHQGVEEWVVTFEYLFPNETWRVGVHEYLLTAACPSLPASSGRWSGSFEVTEGSSVYSDRLYVRVQGVSVSPLDTTFLTSLHPEQPLASSYTLTLASAGEADQARVDCTVTVSLDRGIEQTLAPRIPYRR